MELKEAKEILNANGFILEDWNDAIRRGFLDKIESVKKDLIRPLEKYGLKLNDIKWDEIPEEFWHKYLYKTNWLIADIIMRNKEWLKKEPIDPKDNWLYRREWNED